MWIAIGSLVLAIVLPPIDTPSRVHRYQVTFDISQSMQVEDVLLDGAPATRLALARASAADLLRRLACGSSLGWSVFTAARVMTLVTPLEVCEHYDALLASLGSIDGRMRWENSSSVGKGLHQSLRSAREIGGGTAVVLLTDGQEAPPLGPGQSGIPRVDAKDVPGLVAGVGGEVPVRIPKRDVDDRIIGYWRADEVVQRNGGLPGQSHEELSMLHDGHLAELAEATGLDYLTLDAPVELWRTLDAADISLPGMVKTDVGWLPATIALLALCWRFRPFRRRRRAARLCS